MQVIKKEEKIQIRNLERIANAKLEDLEAEVAEERKS